MLDELRQIAIFARTVDQGSFRAAAKSLKLSPSVVSRHVGLLEKRLGTALLYRSTRQLSLTPEGERLLESAHTMIEIAESGLQDISNQADQPSGVLRITMPEFFNQSILMNRLAEFSLAFPKVELSLDLAQSRRDLIADGFDVAIHAGELDDSSFKALKLYEFNLRLVASPAYLKSRPAPKAPTDLSDWDWLELAMVSHIATNFQKADRQQSVQMKNSCVCANSTVAMTRLVQAGRGLALLPDYIVEPHAKTGELQYVLPEWAVEPISVFVVWPSNVAKNGAVKQLVKFLKTVPTKQPV